MRNYFKLCIPGTGTDGIDAAAGLIDSRRYGVYISGSGAIQAPAIDWSPVTVPGHGGDILLKPDLGNEVITYPAFIAPVDGACGDYPDYLTAYSAFRRSLIDSFALYGYLDLVDTYFPLICRKVYHIGPTEFDSAADLESGKFNLSFSAKPQRFLKTRTITATYRPDGTSLEWGSYNDPIYGTSYAAISPIIRVSAPGTFHFIQRFLSVSATLMSVTVSPDAPSFPVVIDSQRKECYCGSIPNLQNANPFVSFSNYKFPEFHTMYDSVFDVFVVLDTDGMVLRIDPGWWLY